MNLNIDFYKGDRLNKFKRWFSKTFQEWHITNINKFDNTNTINEKFILFTTFINLIINYSKEDITKCCITINNVYYYTLFNGDSLEINLKFTKELMNKLKLSKENLAFSVISNNPETKLYPNEYELWTSDKNEILDVYKLLTLLKNYC